jgi:hypothetical protein
MSACPQHRALALAAVAVDRRGERLTASGASEDDALRAIVEAGARLGTIRTYRVPLWQGEDL